MSTLDGVLSLGDDINKLKQSTDIETTEGVVSDLLPELELPMDDSDLIKLTRKWEKDWDSSTVKQEYEKLGKKNEEYWMGKQHGAKAEGALRDNAIFEAVETALPQMTRKNPEAQVSLRGGVEDSPQNQQYADTVEQKLKDRADELKLRLKIKRAARMWAVYLLGVAKIGWDLAENDSTVKIIRPKKMILDPEGIVDEDGYNGRFIGEYRRMTAENLIAIVPKKKAFIEELTKGELGTDVQFIEWWTPTYMCWTMGEEVLMKRKNPHWNYDKTEEQTSVDDYGVETVEEVEMPGMNHFAQPKMPYVFLSIFNLGNQPVDNTSLISQVIPSQDLINKRLKQIDKNADSMNGGLVVSEQRSGLTKEQATGVTEALRKGGTVVIPEGSPRDAVDRFTPSGLPADVYNQLQDTRARLRGVFGTTGITPAGIAGEQTVRGKIITKGLDADRIGGGISEYLEQFADDIYNWLVQMAFVYDENFVKAAEMPKLLVTVKEGSLLPKDSMTLANQAIDLALAGKLSTKDLFERLEYPNAEQLAVNVFMEQADPTLLYRDNPLIQEFMAKQQQMAQMQAQQAQQQQMAEQQHEVAMKQKPPTKENAMQEVPIT